MTPAHDPTNFSSPDATRTAEGESPTRTPAPTAAAPVTPVTTVTQEHGPAPPPPPPHAAGRYALGEEIARGGMGEVYQATDTALGREVAVKVLQVKYAPDSGTARRFADEAHITAQLQHPNIPPVHDLGTLPDGRPFLAMKLIKGETLDESLKRRTSPNEARGRFVAIFEQVCQAVGYAHAHGVIHRDLKPQNVMVGNFGDVQVMDWGLAKVLADTRPTPADDPEATSVGTQVRTLRDSDDHYTQAGSILGTPAFMAPEQAVGAVGKIDARSDVFGLGGLLAVILTGKPPFAAGSVETTRVKAAQGDVADCFARLDASGAEPELISLCKRCLSPKPADRPADAEKVAKAVTALRAAADERARRAELDKVKAEGEVAAATAAGAERRKRRRITLVAAGVLIAVLTLGVVGTSAGWAEASRQEHSVRTARDAEATQRQQAEANYRLARDTVDRYLTRMSEEKLLAEPHMTRLRKDLLETAREFYARLVTLRGDDPEGRIDLALAHARLFDVLWDLGEYEEAFTHAEAGRVSLTALLTDAASATNARWALVPLLRTMGVRQILQSRPEAGIARLREAVRLGEEQLADRPDEPNLQLELARVRQSLGRTLGDLRRFDDAAAELARADADTARTLQVNPDYRAGLRIRAAITLDLGQLAFNREQNAEAETALEKARSGYLDLIRDGDRDPTTLEYLANTRHMLAGTYRRRGKLNDAEREQFAAIETCKELLRDYPAVTAYHLQLASLTTGLSLIYAAKKDFAKSEEAGGESVAVFARLVAAHPERMDLATNLGSAQGNMGNDLLARRQFARAIEWYDRSIATCEPVRRREPNHFLARNVLRNDYWGRADARVGLGQLADALPDFDRAAGLAEEKDQAEVRLNKAVILARTGDHAGAVAEVDARTVGKTPVRLIWFESARVLARASEAAKADAKLTPGERTTVASALADRAIEALRQARDGKYFETTKGANRLRTDGDLDPLRERDDFKQLLADLEAKFPPKKEVLPPPKADK